MVLIVLVDANLEFIYVDAGQCGRHADGRIWRDCALNKRMEQGVAHIPAAVLPMQHGGSAEPSALRQ